jgi:hypothetical protein
MEFQKYQHLEKLGSDDTEGIEKGTCYIFPKIDGTNSSVWLDGEVIKAGSRNRKLTLDNDNQGFYNSITKDENIKNFFNDYPTLRLYGEWLVPHSLRTYREETWEKFYIFDVVNSKGEYLHYDEYSKLLPKYNLEYIPCITKGHNLSYEQFIKLLDQNNYLIQDGKGVGEGIVVKNYDFRNKYGRIVWAKIVRSEFKELHRKEMGPHIVEGKKIIEDEIIDLYLTEALIEKEYQKIKNESGWNSKMIPRLLNTIYHTFVVEELWNIIKKKKNPTINFKTLLYFSNQKIKEIKKELF